MIIYTKFLKLIIQIKIKNRIITIKKNNYINFYNSKFLIIDYIIH